jgi:hypothetical protein
LPPRSARTPSHEPAYFSAAATSSNRYTHFFGRDAAFEAALRAVGRAFGAARFALDLRDLLVFVAMLDLLRIFKIA